VLGRKEIAGRPLIYATTRKFLETFDLRDLRDLPTPKEIEEFGKAPLEMRGNITIEPDEETAAAAESSEIREEPLEPVEAEAAAPDEVDETEAVQAPPDAEGSPEKKLDFDSGTT